MTHDYVAYCLELLAPLGAVRAKRMFGGHGLYLDGLFIAIVAGERLYLKADAETSAQFEAAACAPFSYAGHDGHTMTMRYYCPPDEALDSPAVLLPWARLAWGVALRARATQEAKAAARRARAASAVAKQTSAARANGASPRRTPRRP